MASTANQGARLHANSPIDAPEHLRSKTGNSAHYNFQGRDVPTSGGVNRAHFETDKQRQGPTKLYLGKATEGASRMRPTSKKGNSTGRVVSQAAKARLSKQGESTSKAKGKATGGLPLRREGPTFGPVKAAH